MGLNFEEFVMPVCVSGKKVTKGDARESLADLIYLKVMGIKAHALAMKIYQSHGETEYSEDEVRIIRSVSERWCAPNFIDGLMAQLENQSKNE